MHVSILYRRQPFSADSIVPTVMPDESWCVGAPLDVFPKGELHNLDTLQTILPQ